VVIFRGTEARRASVYFEGSGSHGGLGTES
jgi:hypothetical protein